jgi:hypothetical protein
MHDEVEDHNGLFCDGRKCLREKNERCSWQTFGPVNSTLFQAFLPSICLLQNRPEVSHSSVQFSSLTSL